MSRDAARLLGELAGASRAPAPSPLQDPAVFLEEIDELRASGRYDWADDTLSGIYDTVKRTQYVTAAQRRAVENIRDARSRRDEDELDARPRRRKSSGGVWRSVR